MEAGKQADLLLLDANALEDRGLPLLAHEPRGLSLIDGPMRFNAIQRANQGLSQRMLSRDLKDLEAAGVLSRMVTATVPPQVEYALTEAGQRLIPILKQLGDWWEVTRSSSRTGQEPQSGQPSS